TWLTTVSCASSTRAYCPGWHCARLSGKAGKELGHDTQGLRRQCSFGFFHDRLKRCRFADGKIRQHLAINGQPGLSQSGNKPAVVQSERPDRCVETLDPERAESALAPFAVAEGVLVCLLDRLIRDTDRILATAVVALGGLQNLLVFSVRRDTTLYAGHGKSPCRTSE